MTFIEFVHSAEIIPHEQLFHSNFLIIVRKLTQK